MMKQTLFALVWLALWMPLPAFGDGGTVRVSQRAGPLRVTVFTSPTPLRAGPVDFSVLVQDAQTGAAVEGARVEFFMSPAENAGASASFRASRETATNKLFQDARFELPSAGAWHAEAVVKEADKTARVAFSFQAAGRQPRWFELWPWFVLPVPVVAVYSLHQRLVSRERRVSA